MSERRSPLDAVVRFFLEQKLFAALLVVLIVGAGISTAPFDWKTGTWPRDPVPVDAIPNLGENQQIVYTEWPGRSPQDVEDQVSYPLSVALLGIPGVSEVRSLSMFGFSAVFLIFAEDVEFYWSRSRILEKLNSLPAGGLPDGVQPALGPDATALGQVFWYTLEGRGPDGEPVGGWDLHELRSLQDWYVRYGLLAAQGISEVASIGGFVQEYHVDVDPDALRAYDVTLQQVYDAVAASNLDVGAGNIEINSVEYLLRGVGFVENVADIEAAVVATREDYTPVRVADVARVALGPAERRGVLTQSGAEAVGGVVVVREGFNPLDAINNVKARIAELAPGLPIRAVIDWKRVSSAEVRDFARARGIVPLADGGGPGLDHEAWTQWLRANDRETWPDWVTTSQLQIVPFYDRTGLIHETLGTLNDALLQQVLVTLVVVLVLLWHLRSALAVGAMLPLAVLCSFMFMKLFGVDSNIVALAGIAIAIGTIVDLGIIVTENTLRHLADAPPEEPRLETVYRATTEVGGAVLTAISTTVISFLPVFTMSGAEGRMFTPLAFTKTFALVASALIALAVVPAALHWLLARRKSRSASAPARSWRLPARLEPLRQNTARIASPVMNLLAIIAVGWVLTVVWEPLGPERGLLRNGLFIALLLGGVLGLFALFQRCYARILAVLLDHKSAFLCLPLLLVLLGANAWLGFDRVFAFIPAAAQQVGLDEDGVRDSAGWRFASRVFPGLGREFLPPLDEGAFLWMPTTMPHASLGEALAVLKHQDMAIAAVPEVKSVTGKIGRADSALDPAPISMIETLIHYHSEYITDAQGRRLEFRYDRRRGEFVRDAAGELIPDPGGRPYRQWREHIRSPQDIWEEIVTAAEIPGTTGAPLLQPIETRLVMLQTGMRAAMGIKLRAPDLVTLDRMALELERLVREVPEVNPGTVNADRVIGKPYLEIEIDRAAIGRYGLNVADVQAVIATGIGGQQITTTIEGRERYDVRVRYPRELRDDPAAMESILVAGAGGVQVPLGELADIRYVRGPQMIRSEDTFLTAYVTFGGVAGSAEVDVVDAVRAALDVAVADGELLVPQGVSWRFAGNYEHQLRAMRTLSVVVPVSLALIFVILYLQFRSVATSVIVFAGIAVAWAGGFITLWLYGQGWFADFSLFGVNMRELFQLQPVNLSVAVWVGFLALFGIAVDDGVVMATYLKQNFARRQAASVAEVRAATVEAGLRRVRPCLMTSATTILALLPVLTSTGRGADLMIPMAIPSVGGMAFVLLTMFTVPVLYCWFEERRLREGAMIRHD